MKNSSHDHHINLLSFQTCLNLPIWDPPTLNWIPVYKIAIDTTILKMKAKQAKLRMSSLLHNELDILSI